jgi:hypothetical protein
MVSRDAFGEDVYRPEIEHWRASNMEEEECDQSGGRDRGAATSDGDRGSSANKRPNEAESQGGERRFTAKGTVHVR